MRDRIPLFTVILLLTLFIMFMTALPAQEMLSEQTDAAIEGAQESADEETGFFTGWTVDLSAGYSLSRGNVDSEDFLTRAMISKMFDETWELITRGEYARGELKNKETGEYEKNTDRGMASAQGNFFVIEKGFLYGLTQYSYDRMRNLDRRIETGAGIGYDIFRREQSSASVEAGASYIQSKYTEDPEVSEIYLRLAQKGTFRLNERVFLLESIEYKPQIEDFSNYILNGEVSLKVNLRSNIHYMFSVINRYESVPASGREKNDFRIVSSLGITL